MTPYDLIVIGGGPSGMMAAGRAAERGARVLLIEKNRILGKKLLLTGGGRCNITNAEFDTRAFLENFPESKDFLYSPFSQFSVKDTFDLFERLGLPLVVEDEGRAFPGTQSAIDVRDTLERYMREGGVEIRRGAKVVSVQKKGEWEVGTADSLFFRARQLIIATGGVAAPETGSTGDGFRWLRELGHEVQDPGTNLVPLTTDDVLIHALAGVALPLVAIRFSRDGKTMIKKKGRLLFTHFGISGPMVLNAAHEVKKLLAGGAVRASVDMFPDLDEGGLDERLVAAFNAHKNKELKNALALVVPKGMAEAVLSLAGAVFDKEVNSVTRDERRKLVRTLKGVSFPITGTLGLDRAIVADGGVRCEDVDMRTMRSKIVPGLYVLGDMLDVNRPSGGFSLQLCWTTGFVAGTHAAERKEGSLHERA